MKKRLFVALLLAALTFAAKKGSDEGLRIYRFPTDSMEPTIRKDEMILVNERAYTLENPMRGDVIVYRSPQGIESLMIKRIVGIPKETIEIRHKKLFINGSERVEPYAIFKDKTDYSDSVDTGMKSRDSFGPIKLEANEFFTMSDNRDIWNDSRAHGPVARGFIHGRVMRVKGEKGVREVR